MSDSAARVRQQIDLDEFERRLRGPSSAPAPQPREQRSLDELARLLEEQSGAAPAPQQPMRAASTAEERAKAFAESRQRLAASIEAAAEHYAPRAETPRAPAANPFNAGRQPMARAPLGREAPARDVPPREPALRGSVPFPPPGQPRAAAPARAVAPPPRMEPQMEQPAYEPAPPRGADMGLRGSLPVAEPFDDLSAVLSQYPDAGQRFASAQPAPAAEPAPQWEEPQAEYEPDVELRPTRSRKTMLLLGGAAAVAVIGLGATFALRGGPSGSAGAPTIAAATGPVKIQPEQPKAGATTSQQASILDRNGSERLAASRMVSHEEQPVDIREAARVAKADAPARPVPGPTTGAAPAGLPTGGPAANGFFPEPRKVRTVSVRPDGTIINPPAPPRPAAAPAAAAPAPAPAVRQITPPPAPAQAAPAGAQSNAIPRPPGSIPSVAPAAPVVAAAPKVTARATPVVSAPVAAIEDEAPARARVAAVAPTAPAASAPRAASAGGDYEVQLAAPGSEREARAAIASARQRHGAALGAQQPTIRKATVGGREIYRVRVVGLSQEEANGLCSKLKASGGACFVARN